MKAVNISAGAILYATGGRARVRGLIEKGGRAVIVAPRDVEPHRIAGFRTERHGMPAPILNRLLPQGRAAHITSPAAQMMAMNGVVVQRQCPLGFVEEADAVRAGNG